MQAPELGHDLLFSAPLAVLIERAHHGIQHVLVAKRLWEEVDGSSLHRFHRHRNVAMAGHEDDRNVNARLGQDVLKLKAVYAWQPDIEHKTTGSIRKLALKKCRGRAEYFDMKVHRLKQVGQSRPHGFVIVNDENDLFGVLFHDQSPSPINR